MGRIEKGTFVRIAKDTKPMEKIGVGTLPNTRIECLTVDARN